MINQMKVQELLPGTKVDIKVLQQARKEEIAGREALTFLSSVFDIRKDDSIEIMMPTQGGKVVLLSPALRYEFIFTTKNGMYKAEGLVAERFKKDGFYLVLIKLSSRLVKYQRREFYRLQCMLPMVYSSLTTEAAEAETMAETMEIVRQMNFNDIVRGYGTILDISGGGIRFASDTDLSNMEYVLIQFTIELKSGRRSLEVVGKIMGSDKPDTSKKYINRIKLIYKDSDFQEQIVQFIFEEERRLRKKGQGE